jgi:hypothetical protein
MSRDRHPDDDELTPGPDQPPGAVEQARADSFARLVDDLVAGDPLPPAMDSDDRALVEVATMIVASTRELGLGEARRDRLIDDALERAVLGRRPATIPPPDVAEDEPITGDSRVTTIGRRRAEPILRALPWVVASLAAAAAVLLFVPRPTDIAGPTAMASQPGEIHRSRPADALVGMIRPEDSGGASERIDTIFSDRMAGYRDLQFRSSLRGTR